MCVCVYKLGRILIKMLKLLNLSKTLPVRVAIYNLLSLALSFLVGATEFLCTDKMCDILQCLDPLS